MRWIIELHSICNNVQHCWYNLKVIYQGFPLYGPPYNGVCVCGGWGGGHRRHVPPFKPKTYVYRKDHQKLQFKYNLNSHDITLKHVKCYSFWGCSILHEGQQTKTRLNKFRTLHIQNTCRQTNVTIVWLSLYLYHVWHYQNESLFTSETKWFSYKWTYAECDIIEYNEHS